MNITENTVAICMATYNGEKYIAEQIDSIVKQTYTDWLLFIRDDGSKDNTIEILKKIINEKTDKIVLIEDPDLKGGSSKKNFAAILRWVTEHYKFQYFMFSDQDDYWLPEKVETAILEVKKIESQKQCPVLVHSDLKVVDADLNVLGESFWDYRKLNPDTRDLAHLLVQNNITGCTMCWNAELNRLLNISDDAVAMHDWWIALVASCFGNIGYIKEPSILYRQHGDNVVGATKVNSLSFIIKRLTGSAHVKETLDMSMTQAEAFAAYYQEMLTAEQRKVIARFADLKHRNKIRKIVSIFKNGYLKQGAVQVIGEVMFI